MPQPRSASSRSALLAAIALAVGGCGGSSASGTSGVPPVPPDTIAPTPPFGLVAVAVSTSQVNLDWTGSTDNVFVSAYRIHRDGVWLKDVLVPTSSDAGLAPSTHHCYRVSARDAAGNESGQCAEACATTFAGADTVAPSAPTGLTATVASATRVDLSWTASTDDVGVTGYRIFRDGAPLLSTAETSASDTAATPRTRVCYTVVALDAADNASGPSTEACATTWWPSEVVDIASYGYTTGTRSDIEVDGLGTVHVSYESQNGSPGYAVRSGGTWNVEFLSPSDFMTSAALALDAQGHPHLAWWNAAPPQPELRHATRSGGAWVASTVDTEVDSASLKSDVALALDAGGTPHVAYTKVLRARHAVLDGASWSPEVVDTTRLAAYRHGVAIDDQGRVCLAYQVKPTGWDPDGLRVAIREAGTWTSEWLSYGWLGGPTVMRSAGGALHVASMDGTVNSTLAYFTNGSGSWVRQNVTTVGGGQAIGFAVDSLGRPHVSYQSADGLRHAVLDAGTWTDEAVDGAGCGSWSALAIDSADGIHVSYECASTSLRYAHWP